MDKTKVKKWLNRGGLIVAVVGFVLVAIGGGDIKSATTIVGAAAAVAGEVMRLVREVMG